MLCFDHDQCSDYAPSDPTPLLEAKLQMKATASTQQCTKQNKALMATEASECKVPVNACCVVDEQGDIHDNAYACIILPLLCGHQPEVPCRVRWFLAIGSGSRGIGSGLCNDMVFLGLYQDVPFREWCFCDYGFNGSHYLG